MTDRRTVRVTEQFFQRLDLLLPATRTADGVPSATDFLLHDLPRVIDRLADGFEQATVPVSGARGMRVLITAGMLIDRIVVYAVLGAGGVVDVIHLDTDPAPQW